jgi:hypothetical protein
MESFKIPIKLQNSVKATENIYIQIPNKFMAVPVYGNETWAMTKTE